MSDERLAARVLEAIDREWWEEATDSELDSVSPFAFDAGISPANMAEANLFRESNLAEVLQRIALRRRLDLPNVDCSRPRRWPDVVRWTTDDNGQHVEAPKCACLTTALDELPGSPRWRVLRRAAKRHREWEKAYPSKPQAAPAPPTPQPEPQRRPLLALPRGDDPPPAYEPPQEKGVWRSRAERLGPPSPLSWAAHKAREEGRTGWMTREF